jgi:chromosomal replication initiation ATPase DnaA
MKRDYDLLASVFSEVYQREKCIAVSLRSVFAMDDERRRHPRASAQLSIAAVESAKRPLPTQTLSRYRQAQLLLPFIETTARAHGLAAKELTGPSRLTLVSSVRHEAMWKIRQETKASFPVIGMAFGGRDHATVIFGVRKFEARLAAEPELRARVLGEGRAA